MASWQLGKLFGIRIGVHWTFLILPIYIYFSSILAGSGIAAAIVSVMFVLAIFGCVLLHELGHALAARQFGIPTRGITLLPIGGVASLERMPRNPLQELWIAVAGPLVNVAIAAILFAVLWSGLAGLLIPENFLLNLALANVILVVFNIIPAFPMDGGRVLRSVLALMMDWNRATELAVSVGKVAAFGMGIWGLLSGNLFLVLIAVFIYFAAQAELAGVVAYSPGAGHGQIPPADGGWGASAGRSGSSAFRPPFFGHGASSVQEDYRGDFQSPGAWPDAATAPQVNSDGVCEVPSTLSIHAVSTWLANRKADYCRVVEAGRTLGTVTRPQLTVALSRGLGSVPIGNFLR